MAKHKKLSLLVAAAAVAALAGCTTNKQAVKPEATPTPAASTENSMGSYVVHKGDCLWKIAGEQDVLGDPFRWPLLYKQNRDQIEDPDIIQPDEDLNYKKDYTESEIADAIKKAKETPKYVPHDRPRKNLPVKY